MKNWAASSRLLIGVMVLAGALAVQAKSIGSEFVANVKLVGQQSPQQSAVAGNGDKAILFSDYDSTTPYPMKVRRFDVRGNPLTSNDEFVGYDVKDIAMDRIGGYAVIFEATKFGVKDIYFKAFNRDGSIRIPDTKANVFNMSNGAKNISAHVIAMDPNGQLTLAWWVWMPDTQRLVARTFDRNGTPISPETVLRDVYDNTLFFADAEMNAGGGVNLLWTDCCHYSSDGSMRVMWRKFDLQLNPLTQEIHVNAGKSYYALWAKMAMDSAGNLVIAWNGSQYDKQTGKTTTQIDAQRISSTGAFLGSAIKINTTSLTARDFIGVGINDSRSFTVAWEEHNAPTNTDKIYHRDYSFDSGAPLDYWQPTLTSSVNNIGHPALSMDASGRSLLFAYVDRGATGVDVVARRLEVFNVKPATDLASGATSAAFAGAGGSWTYFRVNVPTGATTLKVTTTGTTGNADLFGYLGSEPTTLRYDVLSRNSASAEGISITRPMAGAWYFGVYGTTAYTGAKVTVTYQ